MSARVKTPGADVSSLVDELRGAPEPSPEQTPGQEGSKQSSDVEQDSDAAQAEGEHSKSDEVDQADAQEPRDPRLDVKIIEKAPCDRLDDLSDAATEAPEELVRIVEGLIFASPHPIHVREAVQILEDFEPLAVQAAFKILSLGRPGSGLQLSRSAQGYRWTTDPAHASYVQRLVMAKPQRLSRPQLETLAVIAYRQPVTRPEIDHIRGVDSQATIRALVDRELVCVVGQTADPGRPRLYGTTLFFLEHFNITELQSLPPLGELAQLSDRTRDLLRSKVGVDEAERLSAQVLALAKAQDEAAARGEDTASVAVDPLVAQLQEDASQAAVSADAPTQSGSNEDVELEEGKAPAEHREDASTELIDEEATDGSSEVVGDDVANEDVELDEGDAPAEHREDASTELIDEEAADGSSEVVGDDASKQEPSLEKEEDVVVDGDAQEASETGTSSLADVEAEAQLVEAAVDESSEPVQAAAPDGSQEDELDIADIEELDEQELQALDASEDA